MEETKTETEVEIQKIISLAKRYDDITKVINNYTASKQELSAEIANLMGDTLSIKSKKVMITKIPEGITHKINTGLMKIDNIYEKYVTEVPRKSSVRITIKTEKEEKKEKKQ